MITIHKENCPQNHPCPIVARCPVNAISQVGYNAPTVDTEACIACGICATMCNTFELQS